MKSSSIQRSATRTATFSKNEQDLARLIILVRWSRYLINYFYFKHFHTLAQIGQESYAYLQPESNIGVNTRTLPAMIISTKEHMNAPIEVIQLKCEQKVYNKIIAIHIERRFVLFLALSIENIPFDWTQAEQPYLRTTLLHWNWWHAIRFYKDCYSESAYSPCVQTMVQKEQIGPPTVC